MWGYLQGMGAWYCKSTERSVGGVEYDVGCRNGGETEESLKWI